MVYFFLMAETHIGHCRISVYIRKLDRNIVELLTITSAAIWDNSERERC